MDRIARLENSEPRPPLSRWVWLGPLLVVLAAAGGVWGWSAWKTYQFEEERLNTPPMIVPDLKLKLLWIPAGTFVMGTEDEAEWLKDVKRKYNEVKPSGWSAWKLKDVNSSETPTTRVTLTKGFYLGETEVTQAQWEAVMGNKPSKFKGENRPVVMVSWDDCVAFCRKLTERERAAGRLGPKQVFRLPTEAEWEYACRAGSQGEFCFGDKENWLGEFAWYEANSGVETHDVGAKRTSAWGIYDMHGNVWEWCGDWYGAYPGGEVSDPTDAVTLSIRVVRGGCYFIGAADCRSADRLNFSPGFRDDFLGFRVVLAPRSAQPDLRSR